MNQLILPSLALLCLLAGPALAAPRLPILANPAAAPAQPAPATPTPEAQMAELKQKLAEAQADLAQMAARAEQPADGDVATQGELIDAELTLRQLAATYQRHIDTLSKAQSLSQVRAALEREAANWTGFAEPPPYSFMRVDALREAERFQRLRSEALQAMGAALGQEALRRQDRLDESGEKLRQADESLEGKGSANPRLAWLRELALLRERLAAARVEGIQIEQQANAEEQGEARQRLDFIRRQLAETQRRIAFPAADLAQVSAALAAERRNLQAELDDAAPKADAARQALQAAGAALGEGRAAGAGDAAQSAELEDRLELARERAENAFTKIQALYRLLDLVKLRENIAQLRRAAAVAQDAEKARQDYARADKLHAELKPVKDYLEQRLKLAGAQIAGMELQMRDASPEHLPGYRQAMREVYGEREAIHQRLLRGIELAEHSLDLWRQDLDDRWQATPWGARLAERLAQWRELAAAAWAVELFAVEDTIEVEGQPVTGKRSVTLGKVATALLILVAGLAMSVRLAGAVERLVVRRGHLDAGSARIARRWVLFLVGAGLVAASMLMVKIPLTVFAFAGGALAIGTGFGMQNLLKNLISGLMLLLERPFKPGDLVEVGGIRGRVVDIGVRSSQIRDASGIETVIPNSTFVEENVTNWTLSSRSVRIAVKLGVAYGSDVQQVTELLLQAAERHGLVQKEPAPQVLFEDFGADALQFGLHVWVELKPGVDWSAVASDLRHMLYKALAQAGIAMAFPQRDVHLDAAQPLQVRVLNDGA